MNSKTHVMLSAWPTLLKNMHFKQLIVPFFIIVATTNVMAKNERSGILTNSLEVASVQQQGVRVTGTILDDKGQSMPGVTVKIKGSSTGTISDIDGKYSINVPNANTTLVFTMVGYESQEVTVGSTRSINVTLKETISSLNEVVVVGYGEQKKATLTGSVSTVQGADISKNPSPNVTATLAGKLPGLIVTQRSGEPGRDDPGILIRGNGTTGDSSPLIVIDGVPGRGGFSRMNSEDIESISVLKDGSAAIYGNRAANGVILVTTKKGTKGKPQFNFSYNYGFQNPTKIPKVLDAATYAEVYNEGVLSRGGSVPFYAPDVIQKFRDGSDPLNYPNTDWTKLVLKSYAPQERMNLQMTGGSDNSRYLVSFGRLTQGNNFNHNPEERSQYNFLARIDVDISKYLSFGANIGAILINNTFSPVATGTNFTNILQANPTLVGIYPNGLYGGGRLGQSPLLLDLAGKSTDFNTPLSSTFTATFKVPWVTGLRFDASFNYDMTWDFSKNFSTPYTWSQYNQNTQQYAVIGSNTLAELTDSYGLNRTLLYNYRLTYEKNFGKHHITAMVGTEQQQNSNSSASAYRKNFLSINFPQINFGSTAPADQKTTGSAGQGAYNNYFGRLGYDFASKYIFEFIFREDGSQIFPPTRRYGFFPGVSAAWRISEEDFFKAKFPFVDQLKLRGTYGELGNDRVGSYQYAQFFGFGSNYVFGTSDAPGIQTQVLPNPSFTWEISKKTDVGLNGTLWKGLLDFEFTLFHEVRSNILAQRNFSAPQVYGFVSLPSENIGKVNNDGYEIAIGTRNHIGKLSYNINANLAHQRSTVVFIDEVPRTYAYQNAQGHPFGAQLLYQADGIFHTAAELAAYPHNNNQKVGDVKIVDLNGDGKIDSNDQFRFDYNNTPKYTFGLNMGFNYSDFDLSIGFAGQSGAYVSDGTFQSLGNQDFSNASVYRAADRWTPSNPNGTMPRTDTYSPGTSTFFTYDDTFVRLKTLELGYSLPKSIISKIKISGVRLFVSGYNVLTWSKQIKWADPEVGGVLSYPTQRVINLGANVRF